MLGLGMANHSPSPQTSTPQESTTSNVGTSDWEPLWRLLRGACTCSSSSNDDDSCPGSCDSPCPVCAAHRDLSARRLGARVVESKRQRFALLVEAAPLLRAFYHMASKIEPAHESKKKVVENFAAVLQCNIEKIHRVLNLGLLAADVPNWSTIQMDSGWSLFWPEIRKVAVLVKKQPSNACKKLALSALSSALQSAQGSQEDPPCRPEWLRYLRL